jgi:hypothetical protein
MPHWGAILAEIRQMRLLSAIFRLIATHRNEVRAAPPLVMPELGDRAALRHEDGSRRPGITEAAPRSNDLRGPGRG